MKNEIQVIDQGKIEVAFKERKSKELFSELSEMAKSIVVDLSAKNGPKELRSIVYKVRQSKTAFDDFGKDAKEQITQAVKSIDEDRKYFRESCDDLIAELMAPLVAIEVAEQNRVSEIKKRISFFEVRFNSVFDQNSNFIKDVLQEVKQKEIDSSFQEFESQARLARFEAIEKIEAALENQLEVEKKQQEELELQKKIEEENRIKSEQQQKEREEEIKREATEKANREAEEKALFEAGRVQREKDEAAKREAALIAEKEAAKLREQQLKQKAIDDAKRAEIEKQQAIAAEKLRIEKENEEKAESDRIAEEKRIANKAHQKRICSEILQSLLDMGQSEESAKILINAIHSGKIAHVSINY